MKLIDCFCKARLMMVPALMLPSTPALCNTSSPPSVEGDIYKTKADIVSYRSPVSPVILNGGTEDSFIKQNDGTERIQKNIEKDCNYDAKANATAVTKVSLGMVRLTCPATKPHGVFASCSTSMTEVSMHLLTAPETIGQVDIVCPKDTGFNQTVTFDISRQAFSQCGVAIVNDGIRVPRVISYELKDPSVDYSSRQRAMHVPSVCGDIVQP
jgi:hypothetical protein